MRRLAIAFLNVLFIVGIASAQERIGLPPVGRKGFIFRDAPKEMAPPFASQLPLSVALNGLEGFDAEGTRVALVLPASAPSRSRELADQVEALWNANKTNDALMRYGDLCEIVNPQEIEVNVVYKNFRSPNALARTAANAPLGSATDTVRMVGLATDVANGNLFAVALIDQDHAGSTFSHWNFYASTDKGTTWTKQYSWNAGYPINSISISVVHNYCYVGFSRKADQTQVLVYRFSTTDGTQATFADGLTYDTVLVTTAPEAVREVKMFSNHESLDNRLYCTALTSEGRIKSRVNMADSTRWYGLMNDVEGAQSGLSATYNLSHGSPGSYYWISYIDTANVFCIDSADGSSFTHSFESSGADTLSTPSLGAYKDTIFCAVELDMKINYFIRYGAGGNWYWGYAPDTTMMAELPAVAMARGDGIGLAYRYYTTDRPGRFTWRQTSTPGWTPSVKFTDYKEFYMPVALTSLGDGSFGLVYISWDPATYMQAFYATTSPTLTGIEQTSPLTPEKTTLYQNYPNPFNPSTTISYRLASPGPIQLSVYNALGQEVAVLHKGIMPVGEHSARWDGRNAASGAYFVRLVAGDQSLTRMMLLVK